MAGRILVTGAAGFIGSHLVERLLELGYDVVGVDALTGNYTRERKLENLDMARGKSGFRFVEGDLLSLEMTALLGSVEAVAHLAGEPGVRASWGPRFGVYLERNVRATARLLEAAWSEGVGRVVYASSSSVYGPDGGGPVAEGSARRPASPYGLTKLAAEELVSMYARERGMSATSLRYFTVYGPRQRPEMALARFISAALAGERVEIFGDGEQAREMTYVSDVVDATVAALEAVGVAPVYNIGGGTRTTVNGMLDAVREALGMEIRAERGLAAEGDVRSTWADSGLAMRDLCFSPEIGLEEGVLAQAECSLGVRSAGVPASAVKRV